MSERASRLTAVLGILEGTYGVGATTWAGTDAVLCVAPPTIEFEQENVDRNLVLPWMGASEQIPGRSRARVKFKTELVGSGTRGTPPAWGRWLRACGFSETIIPTGPNACVKYTLLNEGMESLAMRYVKAGVRYSSKGARGNVSLSLNGYGIPTLDFEMMGFANAPLEGGFPAIDLSAYVEPQVVNTENSGSFTLNGTLSGVAGEVTGGTRVPFSQLSWNIGSKLVHRSVVDAERIAISDRMVAGKAVVDLEADQEVNWWGDVMAVTKKSVAFRHGNTAGRNITVFADRVQRLNPSHVDDQGFLMQGYDLKALPGMTGAPELTIIAW